MLAGLLGSMEPPRTSGSWPDAKMNSCEILLRRVPSVWAVAAEAIDIEQPSSDRATTALRIRESWCAWDDSMVGVRRAESTDSVRAAPADETEISDLRTGIGHIQCAERASHPVRRVRSSHATQERID